MNQLEITSSGLVSLKMKYRPYVIIGQERTGSNFLQMILYGNPGIICYGEVFNPSRDIRVKSRGSGRIIEAGDDAVEYLKDAVYTTYPSEIRAVGFRLFYTHCRDGQWGPLWEYLAKSDVAVIHLKRRNLLDRYLSHELAMRTNVWISTKQDPAKKQDPIYLDPKKCFEDISRSEWFDDHIVSTFGQHAMLEVYYEDLCDDLLVTCLRIQEFVGVKLNNLETQMQKQNNRPREEMISNFEELRKLVYKGISNKWAKESWLEYFQLKNK